MTTPLKLEALLAEVDTADNATSIQLPATLSRIVLTGFMGAGKSTVGRLIAARLGWTFLDLDSHIESRAGISVPEIFSAYGEPHFRRLESSALVSALGRPRTVIALGGGAPESLTNRLLLEQTPGTVTIFLDAPFPTLFDRCVLQELSRPVLNDPAAAELRFAERHPLYKRIARHTIETSTIAPEETAAAVISALSSAISSVIREKR